MNQWKKYISRGNQHFDLKEYDEAKKCYWEAINRANQLFYSWFDPDEATWAVIVSYQNLADLHEKLDQPRSALRLLKELYDILQRDVTRVNEASVSGEERKAALRRGISCTYTHVLRLSQKLNIAQKTGHQQVGDTPDYSSMFASSDTARREYFSSSRNK